MPADADRIIAIVDPISTGACLAKHLADAGFKLVRVFSDTIPDSVKALVAEGLEVDWMVTVQHQGHVASTAACLRGVGVTQVLCGSEPGVTLEAELQTYFGQPVPAEQLELRRNKYHQSEAVRKAGLSAVHQTLAHTAEDVEPFIESIQTSTAAAGVLFKAVVKPVEGAGSDGVSICNSADQVRAAFGRLEGTKNILGLANYAVLCQEFLAGTEYVVDTVSRGGVHKCVAIWRYDKRDYHGSPVVYHGMQLLNIEADPELLAPMVEYIRGVLDTLGVSDGAMHSEIMATARGPVLVEVNCRLHGGEGIWLPIAQECLQYTQVSALRAAVLDDPPGAFAALPANPLHPMRKHGAWVTIRSPTDGTISEIHHEMLARIRALPSFLGEYFAPCIAVGRRVQQTVDATTVHGCFNLVHADAATLAADCALAQQLINEGLFAVEPPKADDRETVEVKTDDGVRLSFSLTELQVSQNPLWGLTHIWKPLVEVAPAEVGKMREVRRNWRF